MPVRSTPEVQHTERHDKEAHDRHWYSFERKSVVAWLTLAAIVAAALVYWGQLREMRLANDVAQEALNHAARVSAQSTKDTGRALKIGAGHAIAAKQSADAATAALDEFRKGTVIAEAQLIAAHRAYVFSYGVFGNVVDDPKGKFVRLRIGLENSGGTATKNMAMWANWQFRKDVLPVEFGFPDLDDKGNVVAIVTATKSLVPPKQRVTATKTVDLPMLLVQAVNAGQVYLYAWGWARYNDVFSGTPRHVTKFCYRVSRIDPGVDAEHCPQNNCADGECGKAGSQQAE